MPVGAGGDHGGHEGVDAVDDAVHVDVERPTPIVELVFPQRPLGAGTDAGVVAEKVDGTELLQGGVAQLFHRCEVRHVALHPDDLESLGLKLVHRLGERIVVHVGQDHPHPLTGETLAHGRVRCRRPRR